MRDPMSYTLVELHEAINDKFDERRNTPGWRVLRRRRLRAEAKELMFALRAMDEMFAGLEVLES